MIERGHGDVRAEAHRARIGRESAGQEVDERRLAGAIGADDSNSVAAHDAEREIAHDRAIAISFADPLGVDHQRARRLGVLRDHGGRAGRPYRLAPSEAQIGKLPDAPHVTLAARGDAVAHPVLLADNLPVELVPLKLLLLELGVAPGLERAKALVEAARAPAIEPDRGAGQVGEQPLVMADERQRRAALSQARLQPFDRDEIEVVGRLVEQQDVGLRAQGPDQRSPTRFAAGKTAGIGGGVEPELGHHRPRRIGVVEFMKPGQHIVERGLKAGHVRLLRQIGESRRRLDEAGSAVSRHLARRDAEQGRFARSVAPDDGDAVAGGNGQFRAVEKRRAAERHDGVSQL